MKMRRKIMRDIDRNLEITVLSTKEILLSVFDLFAPMYEAHHIFRKTAIKYREGRIGERKKFFQHLSYLRRQGYIETFTENKERFIELTPKGFQRAQKLSLDIIKIIPSEYWDQKWRVVIFDIPEKFKHNRDIFRVKLHELNFIQVQKSVYVFPYDCAKEIANICYLLGLGRFVTMMIADIIQGEEWILERFLRENIIAKSNLKKQK